jgi:hypothetical protein
VRGGAIGLTENVAALHHWMVSGPEIVCMIGEFEAVGIIMSRKNMRFAQDRYESIMGELNSRNIQW